jgi:Uma2 family endonuclease
MASLESRIGTLVPLEEYLSTSYRPDCDYLDGYVVERNVGEWDHAKLQATLCAYLFIRRNELGISVVVEQRVQVKPKRFRIPDVCVVLGEPNEQILTRPPFLCVEILSKDDRLSQMQARIDDYLAMGVPFVWLIDPATRRAYVATAEAGLQEVKGGVLRTQNPALEVPIEEVLA